MNNLRKASLLIQNSNSNELKEIAATINISYRTLNRYKKDPNLLKSAKYKTVSLLGQMFENRFLSYSGDKKYLPLVKDIKNYILEGIKLIPSRLHKRLDSVIYCDPNFGNNDRDFNWEENNSSPQYFIFFKDTDLAAVSCYIRGNMDGYFLTGDVLTNITEDYFTDYSVELPKKALPYHYIYDFVFNNKLESALNHNYEVLGKLDEDKIKKAVIARNLAEGSNWCLEDSVLEEDPHCRIDFAEKLLSSQAIENDLNDAAKNWCRYDDQEFWPEVSDYKLLPVVSKINAVLNFAKDNDDSSYKEVKQELNKDLSKAIKKKSRNDFFYIISDLVDKVHWFIDSVTGFPIVIRNDNFIRSFSQLENEKELSPDLSALLEKYKANKQLINQILASVKITGQKSIIFTLGSYSYLLICDFADRNDPQYIRLDGYNLKGEMAKVDVKKQVLEANEKGFLDNFVSFNLYLDEGYLFDLDKKLKTSAIKKLSDKN